MNAIYEGQAEFRKFLSKIYTDDRVSKYSDPLKPHFNIETDDFNVLHIDSTLTYTKEQEAVDLVIGTKLLQNALKELNPNKPTVLLSHYPFMALLQEEKKYVRELLYHNGVGLWLAGHEHDHMVQKVGYFHMLQAGELRMEERTNATVLWANLMIIRMLEMLQRIHGFRKGGQNILYYGMTEQRKISILFS